MRIQFSKIPFLYCFVRIKYFFSHFCRVFGIISYIDMCKKFIPFAHAQSIYEVPVDFYQKNGVSLLLVDLDNTLDSYRRHEPTEQAINILAEIKKTGVEPVIVSNNREDRVKHYADGAGVDCLFSAHKPFSKRIRKFLEKKGVSADKVMLVGDQLMTDVLAARGAHIRVLLTEKLVKEDQWTTHINRLLDRPIRRHLRKKGKLPDWRTKYGQI